MDPSASSWEQVGARIRQLREARGWSGTDLGDRVGVLKGEVSRVESGRKPLKEDTLAKYADVLEVGYVALRYGVLNGADFDQVHHLGFVAGRQQGLADAMEAVGQLLETTTPAQREGAHDLVTASKPESLKRVPEVRDLVHRISEADVKQLPARDSLVADLERVVGEMFPVAKGNAQAVAALASVLIAMGESAQPATPKARPASDGEISAL
jgi:DNA-binding XRE family transcriptional regulator